MFRWYQNAEKCYVYLPDVSIYKRKASDKDLDNTWEPAFRTSRWFTRGWTLQELLAPASVEFFSLEWKKLGDKSSQKQRIRKITGIPESALEGARLSQFSVNERLLWKENRQTTVEEDKAYSLLGIFGVYIAPLYGEGATEAFRRLLSEVNKLEECVRDLHLTNTRDDKARIEDTKGGLLKDSYRWVLEHRDFLQWRDEPQSQLLWIKGDPGKGKTMLLCGIINEMESSLATTDLLSYFFCQATDSRINNATSVLRGLMYMLVFQQPSLVLHIRKRHDHAGKAVFQDANAWIALSEIFTAMLEDLHLTRVFLIIDALDECVTDLPKLLDSIVQRSSASSRVKWIVSSRNLPGIEEQLERANRGVRLSLELNAEFISVAVRSYIQHKVSKLSVIGQLNSFPSGLNALYEHMINQINESSDAELCKEILSLIPTVYRPIALKELGTLIGRVEDAADDPDCLIEIVGECGSFLTLRENTMYFVHQSAKDFVCNQASHKIFPSGREEAHRTLLARSLHVMSSAALHRDLYDLRKLGYPIEEVTQPNPDPLGALRYSCIYWIDHLCDCNLASPPNISDPLQEGGLVEVFMRTKYLYWLEALSLCQSISKGVTSMAKLEGLPRGSTIMPPSLKDLIYDAYRFIMYNRTPIENWPLRTYVSALLFCPTRSIVRRLFETEAPKWVSITYDMQEEWDACLQTFEGHSEAVRFVVFSHNSRLLASIADNEIKIWDVASGQCLRTLGNPLQNYEFMSADFSHDSNWLVSVQLSGTIHVWNIIDGNCLRTFEWPEAPLSHSSSNRNFVKFSHNSAWLVCSMRGSWNLVMWDMNNGNCLHVLRGHTDPITSISMSHDSQQLASALYDQSLKIWDTDSGKCLKTLKTLEFDETPRSVHIFADSIRLICSSSKRAVVWNWITGKKLQEFSILTCSTALSHDSTQFAYVSPVGPSSIHTLDISTGKSLNILRGHVHAVQWISFSHDSTLVASASGDKTVKVWDMGRDQNSWRPHEIRESSTSLMVLSHDLRVLALAKEEYSTTKLGEIRSRIEIRNVQDGSSLHILDGCSSSIDAIAFSPASTRLAAAFHKGAVKLWDLMTGNCLQSIDSPFSEVVSVNIAPFSLQLATTSSDGICEIRDMYSSTCIRRLNFGTQGFEGGFGFSRDTRELIFQSYGKGRLKVWDTSSGELLQTFDHDFYDGDVKSVSTWNSKWVFAASKHGVIRKWDMGTGGCIQTLQCDQPPNTLSCDATGSYLFTDVGTIDINATLPPTTNTNGTVSEYSRARYFGLSMQDSWITYNSDRLVWLPPESRPAPVSIINEWQRLFCVAEKIFA